VGRIPAVEVLLMNPSVRQYISESRESELDEVIASHERDGMQSFTRSLLGLIEDGHVDPKVAYDAAPKVEELQMLLKGISASRAGRLAR
jgi:Tfp pilus assembly pilus retraction ATPase PilT